MLVLCHVVGADCDCGLRLEDLGLRVLVGTLAAARFALQWAGVRAPAPQVLSGLASGIGRPIFLPRAMSGSAPLRFWVLGMGRPGANARPAERPPATTALQAKTRNS